MIISVDIQDKILDIDGTSMKLEDSLEDAFIEGPGSNAPVLKLRYTSREEDGNQILEIEEAKLRKTYGDGVLDNMRMDGGRDPDNEDEYVIAFYAEGVTPRII